ncbi:HAD family hydrolase [Paenibacillus montanisoli]|uniref:HAD family hydrolase n=1 Tax=Paenibacillus montanisoli TaxID=2081970 RepID=A0A328TXG7_9BACL|nr:HAD family hydrolase [Paenibacillus montanisoli]RAP75177.1 hypothetical protein DL346_17505 [Paenibacillus montanisoli]
MGNENRLSSIKVILFDMDGTLYQEDTFLNRYIRYMLEDTDREHETEAAIGIGRAILSDSHPFRFGHFYHAQDDNVLVGQEDGFVHGLTWEGESVAGLNPGAPSPDLIHIGDPWCIAAVLARKYKLPEEKLRLAFERVRKEMIAEPYRFAYRSDLFQAIEALDAVDRKIVMTNTYLESGIEFLEYMGISHIFDGVFCGAEKPLGIERLFKALLQEGYRSHEILSIGDNPWNDLHPVKRLGGMTCFISPYESADPEPWNWRLTTLDELKKLLQDIQTNKTRREFSDGEDRAQAY